MALIKCSECGKEISDKAIVCPNCGAPNKPQPQPPPIPQKKPSALKRGCLIVAISTLVLFIIVIAGGLLFEKAQKENALNPTKNREVTNNRQPTEEEKRKEQEAKLLIERNLKNIYYILDTSELRTKSNPKGEGLIIYHPKQPLIWIILKDKAYAMNGKSAMFTPDIPFPIKAPEDEWAKTGLDKFSLDEDIIEFVWGKDK